MGGRGSYSSRRDKTGGQEWQDEKSEIHPLHVAGMNRDIAAGVSAEKSLDYLEKVYKKDMTKEQFQVLDDQGFIVRAFQGDRHSVAVDASTRDYARGRIGTHNHPSAYGGTFSEADVTFFSRTRMKEIRASAREGVYSFRRTRNTKAGAFELALDNAMPSITKRMEKVLKRVENRRYSTTVKRRLAVNVLHRWYQRNAPKYGIEYTFERNKDYRIK